LTSAELSLTELSAGFSLITPTQVILSSDGSNFGVFGGRATEVTALCPLHYTHGLYYIEMVTIHLYKYYLKIMNSYLAECVEVIVDCSIYTQFVPNLRCIYSLSPIISRLSFTLDKRGAKRFLWGEKGRELRSIRGR
jgi:hypothetical protein